ncbi:MAG: fibronectin type III domain-containing protein [Eubacterium sp.]|nr:fibronectin type III domain-containing protein [Eubacterium sp.]
MKKILSLILAAVLMLSVFSIGTSAFAVDPETCDHVLVETITKASFTKKGHILRKCKICGYVDEDEDIARVSKIELSDTSFVYNGKTQKPEVFVRDTTSMGVPLVYYTVKFPSSSKNANKYTIKVTLKGDRYEGSKEATYKIVPKGTNLSTVKPATKGITVKWLQQTTQTTGYKIQYSTSASFSASATKTRTISSNKTTSTKLTQVKAGKKYYVRIRTYKKVGDNTLYSKWSAKKAVTPKH